MKSLGSGFFLFQLYSGLPSLFLPSAGALGTEADPFFSFPADVGATLPAEAVEAAGASGTLLAVSGALVSFSFLVGAVAYFVRIDQSRFH
jgi:hypothetical protein